MTVLKKILLPLLFVSMLTISCGEDELKDTKSYIETGTPQQRVFKEFWKVYDRYYAVFFRKQIDWQQVYDTTYPKITTATTDTKLYRIFEDLMQNVVKDGHSFVSYNEQSLAGYAPFSHGGVQQMIDENTPKQISIETSSKANYFISYGSLKKQPDIGYIIPKTFEPNSKAGADFNKFKQEADKALEALKNKKGIVLDVRRNPGGQSSFAFYLAGRFFTKDKQQIMRKRVKKSTGSTESALNAWATGESDGILDRRAEGGHIAGVDLEGNVISRTGAFQYTKKVALLTSKTTASSGELFTVAMKSQSQVKSFGSQTFGIFGGSDILKLENGGGKWKTRLTIQDIEVMYKGKYQSFEGIGIEPDEVLLPSEAQVKSGADIHLDAAAAYMQ